MFCAIPGKTTVEEIIAFAKSAPAFQNSSVVKERWIHPGRYCPNGCYGELWEFQNQELRDQIDLESRARKTAGVFVSFSAEDGFNSADFNVHVDGDLRDWRRENKPPDPAEIIRLEPGEHRIVVRDRGGKRPGPRETNTIHFSICDGQTIRFLVCARGQGILLKRAAAK